MMFDLPFVREETDGEPYVDVKALLDFAGIADTPANRDLCCRLWIAFVRALDPDAKIVAVLGGGNQN